MRGKKWPVPVDWSGCSKANEIHWSHHARKKLPLVVSTCLLFSVRFWAFRPRSACCAAFWFFEENKEWKCCVTWRGWAEEQGKKSALLWHNTISKVATVSSFSTSGTGSTTVPPGYMCILTSSNLLVLNFLILSQNLSSLVYHLTE